MNIDEKVNLSLEQQHAVDLMLQGKNVFLTGQAGSGKSTVIREFRKRLKKSSAVLAPTGIAAVNVNGQTLHSFFMLKPGLLTPESLLQGKMYPAKRDIIRSVHTLIIDEISMVRSDVFNAIDFRCKQCASRYERDQPFGGKQIIVTGDFFQLAPIVMSDTEDDWLKTNCGGIYAFETSIWEETKFETVYLKEIHRQNDKKFLSILNDIRHGSITEKNVEMSGTMENALDALNNHCIGLSSDQTAVSLCTTNWQVKDINDKEISKLTNPKRQHFIASSTGNFEKSDYPTEHDLEVVVGMRVMMLVNNKFNSSRFNYVNGDTGTVIDVSNRTYDPWVKVRLDSGEVITAEENVWTKTKYGTETDSLTGHKHLVEKVDGTFTQLPIKPAYAITIHKSQGMTLDKVDLKLGSGCFSHGQLYTALSRCRTLSGLHLERSIDPYDLILDKRVVDFCKKFDLSSVDSSFVQPIVPEDDMPEGVVPKKSDISASVISNFVDSMKKENQNG